MTGLTFLAGILAASLSAQQLPSFEVASIKPAPPLTPEAVRSGNLHLGARIDNARADFGGASLSNLITRAYRVRSFQLTGTDWMNAARFDILAKLPEGSSAEQVPEMLQALLADRFKLTVHRDSKDFAVYALIVGKDGPKLTPKPPDYDPTVKNSLSPMSLENFASLLSATVDKPVIDMTEMKGDYMISVSVYMNAEVAQLMARARASSAAGGAASDTAAEPTGTDMFSAVQALGLKLEARKMALPMIIVDHLEKAPVEN